MYGLFEEKKIDVNKSIFARHLCLYFCKQNVVKRHTLINACTLCQFHILFLNTHLKQKCEKK